MADSLQTTFTVVFPWQKNCVLWSNFTDVCAIGGNESALDQVLAWHRKGNKPLFEAVMAQFTDKFMRHQASINYLVTDQVGECHGSFPRTIGPLSRYVRRVHCTNVQLCEYLILSLSTINWPKAECRKTKEKRCMVTHLLALQFGLFWQVKCATRWINYACKGAYI